MTTACTERLNGIEPVGIPSIAKKLDAQIVFEGTVGEDNNQLRVTSRVVNSEGLRIWQKDSKQIETPGAYLAPRRGSPRR